MWSQETGPSLHWSWGRRKLSKNILQMDIAVQVYCVVITSGSGNTSVTSLDVSLILSHLESVGKMDKNKEVKVYIFKL